jgi:RND family efflux transporter MFP subunit
MRRRVPCSWIIGSYGAIFAALITSGCARSGPAEKPVSAAQTAPSVTVTAVESRELNRQVRLPGELQAYQDVALYARVTSFVAAVAVDRGSQVKKGELLARLRAPELDTQRSEAEAKVRAAQSQRVEAQSRVSGIRAQRLEAEARLAADEATFQRMKAASATPGVVAGNDLEIAQKAVEAGRARIQAWNETERAAQAQVKAIEENEQALREAARSSQSIEDYLRIVAPFDGVITERNAHEGSLVTPAAGPGNPPILRLQQVSRLRLVVAVPEANVAGVALRAKVAFTVPAFPGEAFSGTVERISNALDPRTRTMPVELEVSNGNRRLAPGMFPEVIWPVSRVRPSMFVPPTAIATTTERSFVIRIRDGATEWVDVKRGASMSESGRDLVEVFGELAAGDQIVVRATDELRAGTKVTVKIAGK